MQCEQNDLERSAIDGESPVCQALQALFLLAHEANFGFYIAKKGKRAASLPF